jgi:hypothetical protein
MSNRITNAHIEAKAANVNRLLGFDPENITYRTIGAIRLGGAYGGTSVERISNEFGSVSMLLGYVTKREVATFLDGMLAALRIKAGQ